MAKGDAPVLEALAKIGEALGLAVDLAGPGQDGLCTAQTHH